MTIQEFEKELQTVHKDFGIKKSKIAGLARVTFQGAELFTIPDNEIYDNKSEQYAYEAFNGQMVPHRTRPEALGMAREIAQRMLTDKDYNDAMTGRGAYTNNALEIGQPQTVKVNLTPLEERPEENQLLN
jgi:hypothetical protein